MIKGTPSNIISRSFATNDAQIIEVDKNKTDESDYSDHTTSVCQSSSFSSEETENSEETEYSKETENSEAEEVE